MTVFQILQREKQYKLHAYVCGPDCVVRPNIKGTVSFNYVLLNRPNECRYAVAGTWDTRKHGERVVVWDLYNVDMNRLGNFVTPKPVWVHDDVDAAVMATGMLYDED
jgi:hypothetical protein